MYLLKDIKSALEVIEEPLQLEELDRVDRTDRTLLHLGGGAVLVLEVADDRGHHSVLLRPRSRMCGWRSVTHRVLGEEAPAAAQHAPDVGLQRGDLVAGRAQRHPRRARLVGEEVGQEEVNHPLKV